MATVRERVGNWLLRRDPELEELEAQSSARLIAEAYAMGPTLFPPQELARGLQEYGYVDSQMIDYLVSSLGYESVSGINFGTDSERESDRIQGVKLARHYYKNSVLTKHGINLWTSYGFGDRVEVAPKDLSALPLWQEFWTADRNRAVLNQPELQHLSNRLMQDGDFFFAVFVNKANGSCRLRTIPTEEIVDRVTNPSDDDEAVFYKRRWKPKGSTEWQEMYYPDWLAFLEDRQEFEGDLDARGELISDVEPRPDNGFNDYEWVGRDEQNRKITADELLKRYDKDGVRADKQRVGTFVLLLPVVFNRMTGWRGWPLMYAGFPWVKAHKEFREDRAAVAKSVAMYVRQAKAKTGSRGIESIRERLASTLGRTASTGPFSERNPSAIAGSNLLSNEGIEWERLSQKTDAGDAKVDGEALAWMIGLSCGVFPHWMGMGDAYRLATASAMEAPLRRQWMKYQTFWQGIWGNLVRIVLAMKERYTEEKFETFEAVVKLDRLVEDDLGQLAGSMTIVYNSMFKPLVENGMIPPETAMKMAVSTWRIVLQAMGIPDVDSMVNDGTFAGVWRGQAFDRDEPYGGRTGADVGPIAWDTARNDRAEKPNDVDQTSKSPVRGEA